MATLLVVIHILCCIFLISIVLLQGGKGAEMGAAFGGSSQTIFGSRGASTFLSKLTTGSAIVFMLTSLILSMVANKHSSVIKEGTATQQRNAVPQQLPQQPMQQQPLPQQPLKK
jgi:preprotein translocase subunit SecG